MDVKKLRECGIAALALTLLSGCGDASSGGSSSGSPDSAGSTPEEVPMMTMGNSGPSVEDGSAPPPPDGLVAAPGSLDPETNPLKGFTKDEKGQDVPQQLALQNVVEAYLRLQPTSSQEEGQEMWPMLTNVNQLVMVGLVRGIPAPPAGKAWAIDKEYRVQVVDAQ